MRVALSKEALCGIVVISLLSGRPVIAGPLSTPGTADLAVVASLQPHTTVAPPVLTTGVTDLKKRQGTGNGNTQNGNGNTQNNGNGSVSSPSSSHGLSQSDKIAIGCGVGGGIVAIIGVIIAYLQLKNIRSKKEQRRQQAASVLPTSQPSQRSGSAWPGPYSYRSELPTQ